jgi:hypothetical protein
MGKWTTTSFIEAFMTNRLGRKRVHGTYRVLEGDHCRLLVRAAVEYGRPAGSSLMAINLQPTINTNPMAFWHHHNYHNLSYRMRRGFNVGQWQSLPQVMMSGEDANLISSGIIEEGTDCVLVEIGDKPYLMYRAANPAGEYIDAFKWIKPVPNRSSNVAEAVAQTKDPEGQTNICGEWWGEPQAFDFMPPVFDPEAVKTMSNPMNPLDYGFTMEEVYAVSSGYGDDEMYSLRPKSELLGAPPTARAGNWLSAILKWQKAAESWEARSPTEYKGLSCQTSRYTTRVDPKTDGSILRTSQGVYVTGKLHSKDTWDEVCVLDRWHKLMTISKRLRVNSC